MSDDERTKAIEAVADAVGYDTPKSEDWWDAIREAAAACYDAGYAAAGFSAGQHHFADTMVRLRAGHEGIMDARDV